MELPTELNRLLAGSLEVLRYMAHEAITAAEIENLVDGMGRSDRGIRKAMRELINKGYFNMDAAGTYFLTDKGALAAEQILAYDEIHGGETAAPEIHIVQHELVAVTPQSIGEQSVQLQFGFQDTPPIYNNTQIVIRLSSSSGVFSPSQLTLDVHPGQASPPVVTTFTPREPGAMVRFRVEAVQMLGLTDAVPVGGMYFDVPMSGAAAGLQAWYGSLSLQA